MKYTVELYKHAVSCNDLAGIIAATVFPHVRDSEKTQEENERDRRDHAHVWLNSKDISKPFLIDKNLYYPITVVTGGQSVVYGYFSTVVSVTNPTGIYWHPLSTPEDAAKEGLKISAQTTKLVKGSEVSKKMITAPQWHGGYNRSRRGRHGNAFICKPEEVIKALALGYLKIDTAGTGFKQILNHVNKVKTPPPIPNPWDTQGTKDYQDYLNKSKIIKVSHTYYEEGKLEVRNDFLNFIKVCTDEIQRTSLEVDPKTELKWRRASKNSMWPYTLDHHWFNAQEGRISVAHHAFKSLMHGGKSTSQDIDKIQVNLPIFTSIKVLDRARKILEHFFSNTKYLVGSKLLTGKTYNGEYSRFVSSVNDLEWPNRKYSQKVISPEMFPITACLALEVIPAFDQNGQFMKFLQIENNLYDNKHVVRYEVDPHNLSTRQPEVTFLLAYSVGLIGIEDLENILGIKRTNTLVPDTTNFLKTSETNKHVHLHLGKNIVLCFPIEYALGEVQASFSRQNLVMYPEAESALPIKALDQTDELEEYTITGSKY
jgi:hypothetical protein